MSPEGMILEHTSGKYYKVVRTDRSGSSGCSSCDIRGDLCSEKGFFCPDLRKILGYDSIFKEVEL